MHEAKLYEKLKDKKVKCKACKQECKISEGKTGICGVRLNKDGKLYLMVYGKASGSNIDPIEKKPFFHFMPGEKAFSIGTIGCNFRCEFCQNYETSQASKGIKITELQKTIDRYSQSLSPKEIVEYCKDNSIPIIAYTYNEPAIFIEYALDTARLATKEGIKNVFVSNGYESEETIDFIAPYVHAMNIDLKSFSDDFYKKICGGKLQNVLDTIKYAYKKGIWIEITTLVIPGKNDSEEELRKIAKFIAGIDKEMPWHISAFFPMYKMTDVQTTKYETLRKAHDIGKEEGLKYVYVGNVPDEKYQQTYCPKCNSTLIKREGYFTLIEQLENGKCKKCKQKIKGIWK
jgi:pyruvate formate lyase activating enzyme